MKRRPVTNIENRNTRQRQKNLTMTPHQQIVASLSFFQFMSDLEQSGSQIPDAWFLKLTFSLRVTFCLTKTEHKTETQLSYYYFE